MLTRTRYIPEGAHLVATDPAEAAVYHYETDNVPYAIAYHGRATRPDWHSQFLSVSSRATRTATYLADQHTRTETMARRRAQRAHPPAVPVGDILHYSWGYEQTNCEYWEVAEVRGRRVTIRAIASAYVSGEPGWAENVRPCPGEFLDQPALTKLVQTHDGTDYFLRMEHGYARPCGADAVNYASYYA